MRTVWTPGRGSPRHRHRPGNCAGRARSRLQGGSIFYLAFLMVQSILMGTTIDYAIVYSKYYKEARTTMGIPESIAHSYRSSINVTLTSSSIIIVVTGLLGFVFPNPAVGAICHTISMGNVSALLMVLFLLPGILTLVPVTVNNLLTKEKV